MKSFLGAVLALAAIGAAAQSTNFNQIQHIETALNHLTVIDLAEPIVTVAVADPDSIQIERHDDKVFIKPLKDGVSTNLFIWTASRQIAYEIDPAGDLAKMNVIVRNAPPPAATQAGPRSRNVRAERSRDSEDCFARLDAGIDGHREHRAREEQGCSERRQRDVGAGLSLEGCALHPLHDCQSIDGSIPYYIA